MNMRRYVEAKVQRDLLPRIEAGRARKDALGNQHLGRPRESGALRREEAAASGAGNDLARAHDGSSRYPGSAGQREEEAGGSHGGEARQRARASKRRADSRGAESEANLRVERGASFLEGEAACSPGDEGARGTDHGEADAVRGGAEARGAYGRGDGGGPAEEGGGRAIHREPESRQARAYGRGDGGGPAEEG